MLTIICCMLCICTWTCPWKALVKSHSGNTSSICYIEVYFSGLFSLEWKWRSQSEHKQADNTYSYTRLFYSRVLNNIGQQCLSLVMPCLLLQSMFCSFFDYFPLISSSGIILNYSILDLCASVSILCSYLDDNFAIFDQWRAIYHGLSPHVCSNRLSCCDICTGYLHVLKYLSLPLKISCYELGFIVHF